MPLYNIENPMEKAMTGLNNAANIYSRMDKKKPTTKTDPLAPVKGVVSLAHGGYQAYSLYDTLKDKLASNGTETATSNAMSGAPGEASEEVTEEFFKRGVENKGETALGNSAPVSPSPLEHIQPQAGPGANGVTPTLSSGSNAAATGNAAIEAPGLSSSPKGITTQGGNMAPQTIIPESIAPSNVANSVAPVSESVAPTVEAAKGASDAVMAGSSTMAGDAALAAGDAALAAGATETAMAGTAVADSALSGAAAAGSTIAEGAAAGSAGGPIGTVAGLAIATIGSMLLS